MDQVEIEVVGRSHEGRGIGRLNGQVVFLENALPGEHVRAQLTQKKRKMRMGIAQEILANPNPDRVIPPCEFALTCGGCSLQHISVEAQQRYKRQTVQEQLQHFAKIKIDDLDWAPTLSGPNVHYRRKARLGVKFVTKKNKVLVGFREKSTHFLTNMSSCKVLDERVANLIEPLQILIEQLSVKSEIPQIEVAAGDDRVALGFRHLQPYSDADKVLLIEFAQQHLIDLYMQPGNTESAHRIWPLEGTELLHYQLSLPLSNNSVSSNTLTMQFELFDFVQVNADVNRQMVRQALEWLNIKSSDRVLDLFCGLGNFTLPLAQYAREAVGIEASDAMVDRGYKNAQFNQINNIHFHAADLLSVAVKNHLDAL
ncbi:MAG: 23S rRNA (uracil(1939)-C(5))-methyltransferase RlmD, partial [Pseudomonadota bacterium]